MATDIDKKLEELLADATNPASDYEGAGKGSRMISTGMKRAEAMTKLKSLGFANTARKLKQMGA